MAKKRIDMRKVRKLLRLHYEQGVDSVRQLSQLCGIGKTTASEYLQAYKRSGLTIVRSLNSAIAHSKRR